MALTAAQKARRQRRAAARRAKRQAAPKPAPSKPGPRPAAPPKRRTNKTDPLGPVRAYVAPRVAGYGRNTALLRSMILPAESQPQRLTNNGGYPTVVTKYGSVAVDLTLAAQSNTQSAFLPSVYLGGVTVPGAVLLLSRQPSRPVGYSPAAPAGTVITQRWFFPQPWKPGGVIAVGIKPPLVLPNAHPYQAHPSYPNLDVDFAATNAIDAVLASNEDFVITPFSISPVGLNDGTALVANQWVEHVAHAGQRTYVWLDAASNVNFKWGACFSASGTGASTIAIDFQAKLIRWDDGSAEDDDIVMASCETSVTTAGVASTIKWYEWTHTLTTLRPGYYRIETTQITLTGKTIAADYPKFCGFRVAVDTVRPTAGIRWVQAPEMLMHPLLYQSARCTAAAMLVSNRTADMYRGGSIMAVSTRDEQSMHRMYSTAQLFHDRASCKPMGYNGPGQHGLYHWIRPGLDDCEPTRWVNEYGSPVYQLERRSSCAIVYLVNTATATQSFSVFSDFHLESEVTESQSYGRQHVPTLATAEYERALAYSASWDVWHENPTHVLDYLKKIGGGAWNAFKFMAPHLLAAAGSAAAGGTPGAALRAVLQSLL